MNPASNSPALADGAWPAEPLSDRELVAKHRRWVGEMRGETQATLKPRTFDALIRREIVNLISLREYQRPVFEDNQTGILVLHWSRQIGKSYTLAAWAVDRLLTRPGRLVTVLSNSRENGAEFVLKCAEICRQLDTVLRQLDALVETRDFSTSFGNENMRMEIQVTIKGDDQVARTGRIKVLAANPRTARGFSGDLILDEFAFHEDSNAIWEAAEPILSSNRDFLCRVASTGNGRHNMFYRLAAPALALAPSAGDVSVPPREGPYLGRSQSGFTLSRVTRTQAHAGGIRIYDPQSRAEVTPEDARGKALDKRAYDQNYECVFADENATLLSHELISAAERNDAGYICERDWACVVARPSGSTSGCLDTLRAAVGPLYVGFDVARRGDLSVITVIERIGNDNFVRAILRIRDMRLPDQQLRLAEICRLPKFRRATIDMTGLGLGLFEYAQNEFGAGRIQGVNFSSTVPATEAILPDGRKRETVRVTEALAMELLQAYEDRRIQHPGDPSLRDDLRKPEKITTPGGRVSIAATRNEAGHADHFWSFALALEAAGTARAPFAFELFPRAPGRMKGMLA